MTNVDSVVVKLEVDLRATSRRTRKLAKYVESNLLRDGDFICPTYDSCLRSRRPGDDFREGIMSHVGRRYDLVRDGRPLRIVVVGQESGLPKRSEFTQRVSLEARYRQTHDVAGLERRYYAVDGYQGRNPHMRGTTTALRLLLGADAGSDREGELLRPVKGRPFHLFDGFALVNRLLCSAGPAGTSQGKPTKMMVTSCERHFSATLSILEPTIVILQGVKVSAWARDTLVPTRPRGEHLYEATLDGRKVLVCTFSHPSAHGVQRWGDRPDGPYVVDVVAPTLRAAWALH